MFVSATGVALLPLELPHMLCSRSGLLWSNRASNERIDLIDNQGTTLSHAGLTHKSKFQYRCLVLQ